MRWNFSPRKMKVIIHNLRWDMRNCILRHVWRQLRHQYFYEGATYYTKVPQYFSGTKRQFYLQKISKNYFEILIFCFSFFTETIVFFSLVCGIFPSSVLFFALKSCFHKVYVIHTRWATKKKILLQYRRRSLWRRL